MKRKLLSFAIAFALLSQTLVFSATGDLTSLITGIFSGPTTRPAIATKITSKAQSAYTSGYQTVSITGTNFDYEASIDMSNVIANFNALYTEAQTDAASLFTDFTNSVITGAFTITFTYDTAITGTAPVVGDLNPQFPTNSIFYIAPGDVDTSTPGTVIVKASVTPVTVASLKADIDDSSIAATDKFLADISMTKTGLSTSVYSSITVAMNGSVDITEPGESAPFAVLTFNGNDAASSPTVTITPPGGGGGSGIAPSNAPTANADSGDSVVDLKVTKIGSEYYVETSDLPEEDDAGNTIYGWYLDEDRTIPVTVDQNGRIKVSGNTIFYSRTIPVASTVMDNVTDSVAVNSNDDGTFTVDMTTLPTQDNDGHTIYGWDLDEDHTTPAKPDANGQLNITSDTFLYPRTKPIASTVVGGLTSSVPVVSSDDKTFTIDVDGIQEPSKDGFAFVGWYTEPNFINPVSGVVTITKDTYLYPRYINITPPEQMISDEHILYVYGYPDGEVKPNNYITREEVAAIFCRLLKPEYRATIETDENAFPDVESGRWSNREISTMANGGYIVGDENGYFNPANPITRAEFTVIASKFAGVETVAENNFTDIEGHWAKDYILKAASQSWITGYEDLTFRPQNKITRAEAMTIVNSMLVRYGDHDSEYAKQWPDLKKTDWYYDQVIEATSHNYYTRNADGWSETWIYADEDNNSHAR